MSTFMHDKTNTFEAASPLKPGSSPMVEAIETNFASLVSALKELDAARKSSRGLPDSTRHLAAACDEFCTSSKRVLRSTIQSVDRLVEDHVALKYRLPRDASVPAPKFQSVALVAPADAARTAQRVRSLVLSQRVFGHWKMYCFGQRVRKAVEKRHSGMIAHLEAAQQLAVDAKSEVQLVEQKETGLRDELARSEAMRASLAAEVAHLKQALENVERSSPKVTFAESLPESPASVSRGRERFVKAVDNMKHLQRLVKAVSVNNSEKVKQMQKLVATTSVADSDKVKQVQRDLALLSEQLAQSDKAGRDLTVELQKIRGEQETDRQTFQAQISEKTVLESENSSLKEIIARLQAEAAVKPAVEATNERAKDRLIAAATKVRGMQKIGRIFTTNHAEKVAEILRIAAAKELAESERLAQIQAQLSSLSVELAKSDSAAKDLTEELHKMRADHETEMTAVHGQLGSILTERDTLLSQLTKLRDLEFEKDSRLERTEQEVRDRDKLALTNAETHRKETAELYDHIKRLDAELSVSEKQRVELGSVRSQLEKSQRALTEAELELQRRTRTLEEQLQSTISQTAEKETVLNDLQFRKTLAENERDAAQAVRDETLAALKEKESALERLAEEAKAQSDQQVEELEAIRTEAQAELERLTQQLEENRRTVVELTDENAALLDQSDAAAAVEAGLRQTITLLEKERDSGLSRLAVLTSNLEELMGHESETVEELRRRLLAGDQLVMAKDQEISERDQKISELLDDIEARARQATALELQIAATLGQVTSTKQDLVRKDKELGEAVREAAELRDTLAARDQELDAQDGDLDSVHARLAAAEAELQVTSQQLSAKEQEIATLSNSLGAAVSRVAGAEIGLDSLVSASQKGNERALSDLSSQLHAIADERNAANARITALSRQVELITASESEAVNTADQLRRDLRLTQSTLSEKQADVESLSRSLETARARLANAETELHEYLAEIKRTDKDRKLAELRSGLNQSEAERVALESRVLSLSTQLEELAAAEEELAHQCEVQKRDAKLAQLALADKEAETESLSRSLEAARARLTNTETELAHGSADLAAARFSLEEAKAEIANSKRQEVSFKQLQDLRAELSERTALLDRCEAELARATSALAVAKSDQETTAIHLEQTLADSASLRRELSQARASAVAKEADAVRARSELEETQREAQLAQQRYEERLKAAAGQLAFAEETFRQEQTVEAGLMRRVRELELELSDVVAERAELAKRSAEFEAKLLHESDSLVRAKADARAAIMMEQDQEVAVEELHERLEAAHASEAQLKARIDLLDQDLNAAETEIEELQARALQAERFRSELDVKTKAERELRARVEEVEGAYERLQRRLQEVGPDAIPHQVADLHAEIDTLHSQLREAESAIQVLAGDLAEAEDAGGVMKNLLGAAEQDLERLVGELAAAETERRKLEVQLAEVRQLSSASDWAMKRALEEKMAEALKSGIPDPQARDLEHQLAVVKAESEELKFSRTDLQARLDGAMKDIETLKGAREAVEKQIESFKAERDAATLEMSQLESRCEAAVHSEASLKQKLSLAESEARMAQGAVAKQEAELKRVEQERQGLELRVSELQRLELRVSELQRFEVKVAELEAQAVHSARSSAKDLTQADAELERLSEQLSHSRAQLDALAAIESELKAKLSKSEAELLRSKDETIRLLGDLSAAKAETSAVRLEVERLRSVDQSAGVRSTMEVESRVAELRTQVATALAERDSLRSQLAEKARLTDDLIAARVEVDRLKVALEEKTALSARSGVSESQLADLRAEIADADRETLRLEAELAKREVDITRLSAEKALSESKLNEASLKWISLEAGLKQQIAAAESELASMNKRVADRRLALRIAPLVAQLQVIGSSREEELIATLQVSLKQAESELANLRAIAPARANNEELMQTVSKLLDEKSSLTNRLGRLEALLESREKGKVESLQQVIKDIVTQANPSILLTPLSQHVSVDAGGSVASYVGPNKDADMCGCLITNAPLPLFEEGLYFEVRVTAASRGNPDGLTVGITTTQPWTGHPIPNTLDDVPHTWAVGYNGQTWNSAKAEWKQIAWSGKDLAAGQRVGVFVAAPPVSQMFVFVDDALACRGPARLPSCFDHAYFGLVDLLGNCDSVTLLWGASPPQAARELVAVDPRRTPVMSSSSIQFRLPSRKGLSSVNASVSSIDSPIAEKVVLPRLSLKPTVEPRGPVEPFSESEPNSARN